MESLVFNATYKSLAAEWLGLSSADLATSGEQTLKKSRGTGSDLEDTNTIKKRKAKTVHKEQVNPVIIKQKRIAPAFEVGEKIQRKLAKAKRRANERSKEFATVTHDNAGSDEEESKCGVVAKKARLDGPGASQQRPLTAEDLRRRLKDRLLSKTAKKKLRRRLHSLLEGTNEVVPKFKTPTRPKLHKENMPSPVKSSSKIKQEEINNFSKSFSNFVNDTKKKTTSRASTNLGLNISNRPIPGSANTNVPKNSSETNRNITPSFVDGMGSSVETGEKHSNKKTRKKHKMKSLSMEESNDSRKRTKHTVEESNFENTTQRQVKKVTEELDGAKTEELDGAETVKRKRKRKKKRSKQKNIKKDHRPDELKPSYLQGTGQKRVAVAESTRRDANSSGI